MRATLPSNLPSSPSICCPLQMITFLLARRGLRASLSPCHIKAHTPEPLHRAPGGDLGCMVLPAADMWTHTCTRTPSQARVHTSPRWRYRAWIDCQWICTFAGRRTCSHWHESFTCWSFVPHVLSHFSFSDTVPSPPIFTRAEKRCTTPPALTRYVMNASTVIYNNSLQSDAIAEEEIEQTGHVICHQMTQFKFKKLPVKNNWLHNWYIRP